MGFSAFRQFLQKQTQQSIPQQLSSPISIVNWSSSFFLQIDIKQACPWIYFFHFLFHILVELVHSWFCKDLKVNTESDLFLLSNTYILDDWRKANSRGDVNYCLLCSPEKRSSRILSRVTENWAILVVKGEKQFLSRRELQISRGEFSNSRRNLDENCCIRGENLQILVSPTI